MLKTKSSIATHNFKRDESKIKTGPYISGEVNGGSHVQKLKSDFRLRIRHVSVIARLLPSRFKPHYRVSNKWFPIVMACCLHMLTTLTFMRRTGNICFQKYAYPYVQVQGLY
jgi:hypothetical protein